MGDGSWLCVSDRVCKVAGGPHYLVRLRTLLVLHDVELHIVAFFETLISLRLNRAVVNEDIGSVISANKP
jgi:hypothetical protein